MGGFFNLDGPFYKWGTEIADIMILSILWVVCSLPIVTIGASTTALFYVLGKKVRKEDPYISKMFFRSFKDNFKQATILTFIVGIMVFSGYLYFEILRTGNAPTFLKIIGLFFIIQVTFITLYIFPVLSRFEMPIKNILISSFIFANKHFITSIICAALFAISFFVAISLNPLSIFAFGLYALASSFLFQRVFTKNIKAVQAAKDEEEVKALVQAEEIEENNEYNELDYNEAINTIDNIDNIDNTKEMENE